MQHKYLQQNAIGNKDFLKKSSKNYDCNHKAHLPYLFKQVLHKVYAKPNIEEWRNSFNNVLELYVRVDPERYKMMELCGQGESERFRFNLCLGLDHKIKNLHSIRHNVAYFTDRWSVRQTVMVSTIFLVFIAKCWHCLCLCYLIKKYWRCVFHWTHIKTVRCVCFSNFV